MSERELTSNGMVPIGSVVCFMGRADKVPNDWAICDGRLLAVATNKPLWDVIGFEYGYGSVAGHERESFRLPDLRGMFLRGVSSDSGHDPDANSRTSHLNASNIVGDQVGSRQSDATSMPNNRFTVQPAGGHDHPNVHGSSTHDGNRAGLIKRDCGNPDINFTPFGVGDHVHDLHGGDLETRPVNVSVYYIIRLR